jgi:hypothetical protein
VPKLGNQFQKYPKNGFSGWKNSGKIPKKLPKNPEYIYIFYKNYFDFFHSLNSPQF